VEGRILNSHLRVVDYAEHYHQRWSAFIDSIPEANLYHDILWKSIFEKTFAFNSRYLICIGLLDDIYGILPLFEIKDMFGKIYLVSIPFFTVAGVCALNNDVISKLLQRAKEIACSIRAQYVELRHLASRSIDGLLSRHSFATMRLKLHADENIVWKDSLNDKARNQVRKAQRSGLDAIIGPDELEGFYKVYAQNMHDLGSPAMPLAFFQNMLVKFVGRCSVLVVKHKGKTIAGMFLVKHKTTMFNPFASSLKKYNFLCPNNLAYWEAIKMSCRNGLSYFDFGRSTIGTGPFKFKLQWGAIPENLSYQYSLCKTSQMPICDAINNRYDLAIKIWKRLPIWVTNYIGPKIVRYLPEL